jgi:hypothetical protein
MFDKTLFTVAMVAAALVGCGGEGGEAAATSAAPKAASAKASTSAAAASTGAAAASTGAAAADDGAWIKTGNAACDAAAEKFAACLDKDAELKKKFNAEVAGKLKAIKAGLEDPATKGMQEQSCTMYFEMKQMQCK